MHVIAFIIPENVWPCTCEGERCFGIPGTQHDTWKFGLILVGLSLLFYRCIPVLNSWVTLPFTLEMGIDIGS